MMSIRKRIDAGVCSAGLSTTQLPAASAGASFHVAMRIGKFHGMIWPTTPSGSWKWYATVSSSSCEMRALLRAQHAGEVAEVVDRERDVGGQRLADGLAVLPRLGDGDRLEVLLDAVGDLVEDVAALGRARLAPRGERLPRDIHCPVDVFDGAAADLAERLAVDGRDVLEVLALHRVDELAADVVAVAGAVVGDRAAVPGAA